MFIDSHCHLTDEQFANDLDAVIARASAAGVTRLVTLAVDLASSQAAVTIAEKYPTVYAAVGVHPEAVSKTAVTDLHVIRELAAHPKVVAIGEIGLDYYWDTTTIDLQKEFLIKQLALARELNLPTSIHDREAHMDVLAAMEQARDGHGVLHAFSGDLEMAQRAFELGYCVSFGGPVTFKNALRTHALVAQLPLEGILIETDSPYLTPQPWRGKRNEPAHIVKVAGRIAELKGLNLEQVAAQTSVNAMALFRFNDK